MSALRSLCCTAAVLLFTALAVGPAAADNRPWFAAQVGNATQVISVVGVGGSNAKMDLWQRGPAGWQPVAAAIPAQVGSRGMSPNIYEGSMMTPMGVFTLNSAFGTKANPGTALPYVQVGSDHWWSGDVDSPTYNSMQVCRPGECDFDTGPPSENLDIPEYGHAVVMGVNSQRTPGKGSAFFLHESGGGPTAGCVAIDAGTLTQILQWLRPGALIAIAK